MNSCFKCGKEIDEGVDTCPNCGQSTSEAPPSVPPRGKFNVEAVIVSSFGLIRRKPMLLLPQIITTLIFAIPLLFIAIPLLFIDIESPAGIIANLPVVGGIIILAFGGIIILAIIVLPVIGGMYPLMVKNVMEGREVEMSDAFAKSLRRFPSLIGASILVGLLVALGLLLLVVPGIIFFLWYAYTIPAIMLENLGARDGMSASKRFCRTVKLKTFLIILIIAIIGTVGNSAEIIPVVGFVIGGIVGLIVATWGSISISYAYIKYGMATPKPS